MLLTHLDVMLDGGHDVWPGIKEVSIIHRPGKQNIAADALSCSPCGTPAVEGIGQDEVQVATVNSGVTLTSCNNVDL